jgi:hypothetical protein
MLDTETLLRSTDPHHRGLFMLSKAVFLINPSDTDRCDNLSYTGVNVAKDTDYEYQSISFFKKPENSNIQMEIPSVVRFEQVISCPPDFFITYIELKNTTDTQKETMPSLMWHARSFFSLLKTMREWQYVYTEDIDPNHPMAIYSNIAINKLNPPENIMSEIDGWPDMQLAKFFKGREDYKLIPEDFPEPSEEMKNWVQGLTQTYSEKTFSELLEEI